ncbi:MAG: 4Fe-4S binding protein [Desulfovibrionaceae bacterium]|nr:4Fe-4S binding protein [Desulfovibrionaceae bacterium]
MSRIVVLEDRCKGCLLCVAACPAGIIRQSGRFNQNGYKVVEVPDEDKDKCTGCASCAITCPDVAIRVYRSKKKEAADD